MKKTTYAHAAKQRAQATENEALLPPRWVNTRGERNVPSSEPSCSKPSNLITFIYYLCGRIILLTVRVREQID